MTFFRKLTIASLCLLPMQTLLANIAPSIPKRGLRVWVLNADAFPDYRFYIRYIPARDTIITPVAQGKPYFLEGRSRITRPLMFFAVRLSDGAPAGTHDIYDFRYDQNIEIIRIEDGKLQVKQTRRGDTSHKLLNNLAASENPRQWLVWGSVSALLLLVLLRFRPRPQPQSKP
jgi:hypothetical protein